MWKTSLFRGLVSYCICTTVTMAISAVLLLCGAPHVCTPDFIARVGSEPLATCLQPLAIGLIGFAFGAGSVLFEIERWSFLKQGAAHLLITAAVWIVVELICFAPITPPAVVSFAASAAVTYAITWGAQYLVWRAKVRRLNERIRIHNEGDAE